MLWDSHWFTLCSVQALLSWLLTLYTLASGVGPQMVPRNVLDQKAGNSLPLLSCFGFVFVFLLK